jgi:hypothetical protein
MNAEDNVRSPLGMQEFIVVILLYLQKDLEHEFVTCS